MTNLEHIQTVIVLAATGFGLWAAFYHMYIPSVLSSFRESLFAERHKLFALVADGRIQPTHPAYVRTRSMCNGLIRFADRLELPRVLLMALVIRRSGVVRDDWEETVATVDADVREEIERIRTVVSKKAFALEFVRSPFWLALGAFVVVVVLLLAVVIEVASWFIRRPKIFDLAREEFRKAPLRLAETAAQEEETLRPCAA